ncbi:MAG: hypothetical protein M1828_004477 [Chrysothrix sp. TS-e1954]|nr:MAG: hypothetical protein M1828_004477 [Chrysothrix sp. TS-e1954]
MAPRTSRKRAIVEVEEQDNSQISNNDDLLRRIRNTWQFANLMQYIQIFGSALKIDNELDVEMLEDECLKPGPSDKLAEVGLCFLKWISSHRGLTPALFDEYTRRQFVAKAPQRNPFGEDDEPRKFAEFDVFTKLKVLHQMSVWTLNNPDKIRERMEEKTIHQTSWRMEPLGWDREDRTYFVFGDNRLYRKTDPKPEPATPKKAKPKAKSKAKPKKSTPGRSSKRQKLTNGATREEEPEDEEELTVKDEPVAEEEDDGLGGATWECIAVSLEEYNSFLESLRKSKDPDERNLIARLNEDVLPEIERAAASRERRAAKRQRELQAFQSLANAKRSSRLADKQQKQQEDEAAAEAERQRQALLAQARKEEARQVKMEHERDNRILTREQRTKDREMKRVLAEERLKHLESRDGSSEIGEAGRHSERHRKAKLESDQREREKLHNELNADEEDWYFDCEICLKNGENLDDGTHSMACDRCGVWQHSACHNYSIEQAEAESFHFVCRRCAKPVKSIRLNVTSSSPPGTSISQRPVSSGSGELIHPASPSKNAAKPVVLVPGQNDSALKPPAHGPPPMGFFPPKHSSRPSSSSGLTNGYAHTNGSSPYQTQSGTNLQPHGQHANHASANKYSSTPSSAFHQTTSQQSIHHQQPYQTVQPQSDHKYTPHANSFDRAGRPPSSFGSSPHHLQGTKPSSPTPSLTATQGATDVRFSPTRPPSAHGLSTQPGFGNGAPSSYSPTSSRPAAGGVSPTKQASSPPMAQTSPSTSFGQAHGLPGPQFQQPSGYHTQSQGLPSFSLTPNGSSNTTSGISPVKHEMPPSSPPAATIPNSSFGMPAPPSSQSASFTAQTPTAHQPHTNGIVKTPNTSFNASAANLTTPGTTSHGHPTLSPAIPTLSPSVNAHGTDNTPPVKKRKREDDDEGQGARAGAGHKRSMSGRLDVSGLP